MDEINHFVQLDDETMYEAWEMYKDLLRSCPQHGMPENKQITTFFSCLIEETQEKVNQTADETFVNRPHAEAKRVIEEMVAINNRTWARSQHGCGSVADVF